MQLKRNYINKKATSENNFCTEGIWRYWAQNSLKKPEQGLKQSSLYIMPIKICLIWEVMFYSNNIEKKVDAFTLILRGLFLLISVTKVTLNVLWFNAGRQIIQTCVESLYRQCKCVQTPKKGHYDIMVQIFLFTTTFGENACAEIKEHYCLSNAWSRKPACTGLP